MTPHELEFKELIDSLGNEESYDRLKPGLFRKMGIVAPSPVSFFTLGSVPKQIEFNLNTIFTTLAFRDSIGHDQFVPYVFELVGHYTQKSGMQYEKILIDAHYEDNMGYHKVTIEFAPDCGTITMDEYIEHCMEQLDDDFDTLTPEEQTVKTLCGYVRPTSLIVNDIRLLHEKLEVIASRSFQRQRKLRIVELLIGQWFSTITCRNKNQRDNTKIIAIRLLANVTITYFLVRAYVLFAISLWPA